MPGYHAVIDMHTLALEETGLEARAEAAAAVRFPRKGLIEEKTAGTQGGGNARGQIAIQEVCDQDQVETLGTRRQGDQVTDPGIKVKSS